MALESKLTYKIKLQLSRFAGCLTEGWGKVANRFVGEMLYGIQAAGDVKVSEVSRALRESIPLIKTENRLCRNLSKEDLTAPVNRRVARKGAPRVKKDTVLAVDIGDLRKEYATEMENLARIWDGSTGEMAWGYWLCQVVGAHPTGDQVIPLYGELYSQKEQGFRSENSRMLRAIHTVMRTTEGRGIIAIDRGGDRRKILHPLMEKGRRFVVRQDGDRHVLMPGGKKKSVCSAGRWCRTTAERKVEIEKGGKREVKHLILGSMPVRLPEKPEEQLWLVVIRGFGKEPVMLLTNVEPEEGVDHPVWIGDLYLTRGKCEEAYRFLKQSYNLEDVRVRSYVALRNTYALLQAVMFFVSIVIGARAKVSLIFKKSVRKPSDSTRRRVSSSMRWQTAFGSSFWPPEPASRGKRSHRKTRTSCTRLFRHHPAENYRETPERSSS